MSPFDRWRKEYPDLTYRQHQEYAVWLYENYPDQSYFGKDFARQVIDLCRNEKPVKVMELGGWDGELAKTILKGNTQIELWDNFEICPAVSPVCEDIRYSHMDVDDFVWNFIQKLDYDLFVSSHALEHLNTVDLKRLLDKVKHIPYLAFQLPFPVNGSWAGQSCFHILELSSVGFVKVVCSFGFILEHYESNSNETRFFFRRRS